MEAVLLRFEDPNEPSISQTFLAYTNFSKEEIQELAEKTIKEFMKSGNYDWSYEDLAKAIERRTTEVVIVPLEEYTIII